MPNTNLKTSNQVIIFTDGACKGNPGPGGWGAYLRYQHHEKKMHGGETLTTNNRMELTAVIRALATLKKPCSIVLTTDSQYVKNGVTTWLTSWKKNNWKTSAKKPVKNMDLWLQLDQEMQKHHVEWLWVRGHTGNAGNEIADELANRGIDENKNQ
jgi:ribonuclease HI